MFGIIDTHAHLVCDELYPQVHEIIARAKDVGVSKILCICMNHEELKRGLLLHARYDEIDLAYGFHPSDLYEKSEQDYLELEQFAKDDRICAIGEIGLDYYWKDVDIETQKTAFIRQIQLANAVQKPILIHMRDATKDTLNIIKEHVHTKGILHCFSGSFETAKLAIAMGMYISLAGPLTFKNARGLPEVVENLPLDKLFVETDCPYLTPHPFRGKRNEVMYVTNTFDKLCEVKNMDRLEVLQQMQKNYQQLFNK